MRTRRLVGLGGSWWISSIHSWVDAVRPCCFCNIKRIVTTVTKSDKLGLKIERLVGTRKTVVDILDQCACIGELHHAIASDLMIEQHVHAELGEVIAATGCNLLT